jgi:hypothetical protein
MLIAAAFAGAALAQTIPASLTGSYTGTSKQNFGLADPTNPTSWECLPGSGTTNVVTRDRTMNGTSSGNTLTLGAMPATTYNSGVATFTLPAVDSVTYGFAAYDPSTKILQLRNPNNQNKIECHRATESGSGNSRSWTIVTLSTPTSPVTDWPLQCDEANYKNINNVDSQPFCSTTGSSRVAGEYGRVKSQHWFPVVTLRCSHLPLPRFLPFAVNSTVLNNFNYQSGGDPVNGADGTVFGLISSAIAAGVAMAGFVMF